MSNSILNQCWPLKMPPTVKSVLISLADNADDFGRCFPSIEKIMERTCFGRNAVIDAIRWLEAAGAIKADRSNGRKTTYSITVDGFDANFSQQSRRMTSREKQPNQLGNSTSGAVQPVGQSNLTSGAKQPNQLGKATQPVGQSNTNHHEPSIEPSITTTLRAKRGGSDLPDGFAEFWAEYPNPSNKANASKSWKKLALHTDFALRAMVMAALGRHRQQPQWTKDGGQYVPHASTWLNQERYLDEVGRADAVLGHKVGTDEYLLDNRTAQWWRDAGFENVWEAANANCWHTNAHKFRDGKLIPVEQEVAA